MSYYSPSHLLLTSTPIPCHFDLPLLSLGYLDPTSSSPNIPANTTLPLPLWLAQMLSLAKGMGITENAITLDMPEALNTRVLNALKADPKCVELRGLAMYWYGLVERVLGLWDEEEVTEVAVATYRARAAEIGDLAVNPSGAVGGEAGAFLRGLDEDERRLFRIAHESAKAMKQYMSERSSKK